MLRWREIKDAYFLYIYCDVQNKQPFFQNDNHVIISKFFKKNHKKSSILPMISKINSKFINM